MGFATGYMEKPRYRKLKRRNGSYGHRAASREAEVEYEMLESLRRSPTREHLPFTDHHVRITASSGSVDLNCASPTF